MGKKIIGRTDKVDFPELGLENIDIKIDTGAYTSSIHCTEITEKEGRLTCFFLDRKDHLNNKKKFTFADYKHVVVKSSNGAVQHRYAIKSTIKIFGKTYRLSLSLNDRSDMRFPVLIGRKFLSGKFIVDPQLKDLSVKEKNKT
ncbi:MAG TPA: RimK/LysX family protein [Flavobacteriaceae bacterium]|nr:RimK/LysX family protein [Flavobacteriaceae bacterium]